MTMTNKTIAHTRGSYSVGVNTTGAHSDSASVGCVWPGSMRKLALAKHRFYLSSYEYHAMNWSFSRLQDELTLELGSYST